MHPIGVAVSAVMAPAKQDDESTAHKRRPHRKSRMGCAECRRRRIKVGYDRLRSLHVQSNDHNGACTMWYQADTRYSVASKDPGAAPACVTTFLAATGRLRPLPLPALPPPLSFERAMEALIAKLCRRRCRQCHSPQDPSLMQTGPARALVRSPCRTCSSCTTGPVMPAAASPPLSAPMSSGRASFLALHSSTPLS